MKKPIPILAVLVGIIAWLILFPWLHNSSAQTINVAPQSYQRTPGYVSTRFYPGFNGTITTGTAVGTLDTIVYLLPFVVQDASFTASSLNVRTITAVVNCGIKMALWRTSATTKRPTGTPIAGSNTGQACTTNSTVQSVVISQILAPGVYWTGTAITTGASTFVSSGNTAMGVEQITGRAAFANNTSVTALSAPYTYASDITALDLTSATFTDQLAAVGAPIVQITAQ